MEEAVLAGVWVAAGIVLGFVVWTFVSPNLGSVTPVPTA